MRAALACGRASSPLLFDGAGCAGLFLGPLSREAERRETRKLARLPERLAKPPDTLARRVRFALRSAKRRLSAQTQLQARVSWDEANMPVPVQRSTSRSGRNAARAGSRSRPGAGLRAPPAGAASCPVIRPSLDDALVTSRTAWTIFLGRRKS